MPRVSEAEKQKSRERILDAAARLIRERGVAATSVADVMGAAGMTHGGFYRHFASKEELTAAAFRYAVDSIVSEMETAASPQARRAAWGDYLAMYLSAQHVRDLGAGCPLAAIGTEAGRGPEGLLRDAVAETVERMAALLDQPDGAAPESEPAGGTAVLALLLGTITLARLADDPATEAARLAAGRAALDVLLDQGHGADGS